MSMRFLYFPIAFSLLGLKLFLNVLFSNSPTPCSSQNFRDQPAHLLRQQEKIYLCVFLYIRKSSMAFSFIFIFIFTFIFQGVFSELKLPQYKLW